MSDARGAGGREDLLGRLLRTGRALLPSGLKSRMRWVYAGLPQSWRMSSRYRALEAMLRESQHWDAARMEEFQLGELRKAVRHARDHVPAYAERFAAYGVGPDSIVALDDLARFPFLEKEDLRGDPRRFLARGIEPDRLQLVTSGGTTGAPTSFYHLAQYNEEVTRAFRLALWARIGFSFRRRILDLTASFGEPFGYVPERRSLYVSIAHLHERQLPAILERVRRFRPEYILGLPSTATLLAQLLREAGEARSIPLQGVVVGSEVLYPWQRELLRETFGGRVLSWYGMGEGAGFAAGCEHSDEFHFSPEAGVMELVDDAGRPVRQEGAEGEIVLTGFHTLATPFIRFRTGDRGVLGARSCALCGRPYPLLREISGRTQEYLVGLRGTRVPNSALNVHSTLFEGIRAYQFYQSTPGRVVLRMVPTAAYRRERDAVILEQMRRQLGPDFELELELRDEIPRTARGKHKFIVQELDAATPG